MLINYLETARMAQSGVIYRIEEVSPTLTYVGTRSYLSNGVADDSKPGWKIQRIKTVGTIQTVDRPLNQTNTSYQELSHIWDDRATLNRQ